MIKLSGIRAVIDSGRHALLDITPGAVQRLNFAQLAPIVLFLRPEGKPVLKELRSQVTRFSGRAGKRALEDAASMEAMAGHLFTGVVPIRIQSGGHGLGDWFTRLVELVQHQQREPTWMTIEASVGPGRAVSEADISLRLGQAVLDVSRLSAPNLLDAGDFGGGLEGTLTRSVSDPHLLSPPKRPGLGQSNGWDAGYASDDRYQPATVGRMQGRGLAGRTRPGVQEGPYRAANPAGPGLAPNARLWQSSSALLNGVEAEEAEVDPYAVHTLPGECLRLRGRCGEGKGCSLCFVRL